MNQKEQIAKIKSLKCKKHIKIYRIHQLGLTNPEVAKALGTNAGHVHNALELYKKKPSFKKIAENIETIIAEKSKEAKKAAAKKSVVKKTSKATVKKTKPKKEATKKAPGKKPSITEMANAMVEVAQTEKKVRPKRTVFKDSKLNDPLVKELQAEEAIAESMPLSENEVVIKEESEEMEPDEE